MSKSWEIVSGSEDETLELGSIVGRALRPGDAVYLNGELGAGKTRIAKGIVSGATGVSPDEVVSPTFTLVNTFEGEFPVHHADLYRLAPDQVETTGLEEALDDGAVIVEWAEKAVELAEDPLHVVISYANDEGSRRISVTCRSDGSWPSRLDDIAERLLESPTK
jgi:tRNA threonylcarbamoyl adenosine modification protein YjeE